MPRNQIYNTASRSTFQRGLALTTFRRGFDGDPEGANAGAENTGALPLPGGAAKENGAAAVAVPVAETGAGAPKENEDAPNEKPLSPCPKDVWPAGANGNAGAGAGERVFCASAPVLSVSSASPCSSFTDTLAVDEDISNGVGAFTIVND